MPLSKTLLLALLPLLSGGCPGSIGGLVGDDAPPADVAPRTNDSAAARIDARIAPSPDAAATGDGSSEHASSATADSSAADATSSASADSSAADATSGGCQYKKVFEQLGTVLDVVEGGTTHAAFKPLPPGAGFYCLRVSFDMRTADTVVATKQKYDGQACPIYTAIGSVNGSKRQLGGALFKIYKVGCTLGPQRVEVDTFADANVQKHATQMGETYRVVIEVVPFTSTIRFFKGGQQVGADVSASIAGATVADTRDAEVVLGISKIAAGAYFPNFGARYSNLRVEASLAP